MTSLLPSRTVPFMLGILSIVALGCQNSQPNEQTVYEIMDLYFEEKGEQRVNEAIEVLLKRKADAQPDSVQKRIAGERKEIDPEDSPSRGAADAKVLMIEFTDFGCPFSKMAREYVEPFMKQYGDRVRHIIKHFPQDVRYDSSQWAHRASIAADRQGKFWEFYKMAYDHSYDFSEKFFLDWAKRQKLDVKKFESDMNSPEVIQRVERERDLAKKLGAPGSPTFYFNGVRLSGVQPIANFVEMVDTLLFEIRYRESQDRAPQKP